MPSNACDVRVSESNCMKNGSRLLRCSVKTPPNKAVGWLRIAENSSGRPPGTKHLRKMPKFAGKETEPRALITSLEIGKLPITKPSQHSEFCIKALCRAQQPPAPRPQGTDSQSEPRPQARGRGPSVRPEFELRGTVEVPCSRPATGPSGPWIRAERRSDGDTLGKKLSGNISCLLPWPAASEFNAQHQFPDTRPQRPSRKPTD